MRRFCLLLIAFLVLLNAHGQTQSFDELIESQNFAEAVKFENQADKLTPHQLLGLGFAFFAVGQSQKAVEIFDLATARGNSNELVSLYKGKAELSLKKYPAAIKSLDLALAKQPNDPNILASAARANALDKRFKPAVRLARKAIQQPDCDEEAFEVLAYAAGAQGGAEAVLAQFNSLRDSVAQLDENYCLLASYIGRFYVETEDYSKAASAFRGGTVRCPEDYVMQRNLLLAYNKTGRYAAADSVFKILGQAFQAGKLPETMSKPKNTLIYTFPWRVQSVRVMRYYVTTTEEMKPVYRIMLFDEKQEDVERSLMIQLRSETAQKTGVPYSLAEYGLGNTLHRAYGVYWKTSNIPVNEIEAAVTKVLNETYVKGERSGPDKGK